MLEHSGNYIPMDMKQCVNLIRLVTFYVTKTEKQVKNLRQSWLNKKSLYQEI